MEYITAVILAAGKGKRMQHEGLNKVAHPISGTPIVRRTIDTLILSAIDSIIVVVGHEKKSVLDNLPDEVAWIEQEELLGTGDAVKTALPIIPLETKIVFILYGDDSYFLTPEIIDKLYNAHVNSPAVITFATITKDNPQGLGRIIRDENGKLMKIVEEVDANLEQKEIHEVNIGCFLMDRDFLENHINEITAENSSKEYYITDLIERSLLEGLEVQAVHLGKITWRGINTPEELIHAREIFE